MSILLKMIMTDKQKKLLTKIVNLDYPSIKMDGCSESLKLYQSSMFSYLDPIKILSKYKAINPCMPLCIYTQQLIHSILHETRLENQTIEYKKLSGITHANDKNWKSLKDYSKSLLPRCKWNKNINNYYGFETNEDFDNLKQQVIGDSSNNSPFIEWVEHFTWNNRYYIANHGGSHRCAALYRQNFEQNKNLTFTTTVNEFSINEDNLNKFFDEYYYIITSEYIAHQFSFFCTDLVFCSNTENDSQIFTVLILKKTNSLFEREFIKLLKVMDPDKILVVDKSNYIINESF